MMKGIFFDGQNSNSVNDYNGDGAKILIYKILLQC